MSRRFPRAALTALALVLAGCDGSSGGPGVDGVLVVPESAAESARAALASRGARLSPRMEDCPGVPDGYRPLADAEIVYTDVNGTPVGTSFRSDVCGAFRSGVPAGAIGIVARSIGFRPIETDISLFTAGAVGVASTIPITAAYRIGAIQALDDGTLAFAITDTESGQAVLGMPASAFDIALDEADVAVSSIRVAASTTTSASSVLVLDASRSMDDDAYTDPDTGETLERRQLATLAAHLFLDQKDANDEVAALLFSDDLFFMDQETIDREIPLVDAAGEPVPYALSADGFATDAGRLRLVVDSYNRRSDLYADGTDRRHPDTPNGVSIPGRYPYEGATAVYDAIGEGVARLDARAVARPVVVAMTDGDDNRSGRGVQAVIDEAIAANVPVYTVGFGGDTEEELLTRIAEETGGSYFSVTSIDIANVYQSIQTGILFQYIATLTGGGLDEAFTLGVALDYNGLQAERTLTVSR